MKSKHIHRYTRMNIGKGDNEYWVMKCNLPGCNSYTPGKGKYSYPRLRGQVAVCNKCNENFELNRRALNFAKPICDDCVDRKGEVKLKSAEEFFDGLMKGLKDGTNP